MYFHLMSQVDYCSILVLHRCQIHESSGAILTPPTRSVTDTDLKLLSIDQLTKDDPLIPKFDWPHRRPTSINTTVEHRRYVGTHKLPE